GMCFHWPNLWRFNQQKKHFVPTHQLLRSWRNVSRNDLPGKINMLRLRMPERNYIFICFIFEGIGK
ncbi:MAG: hypothetical protein WBC05_20795, partial [Sedimentisphaerales bacterium]